MGVKWWGWGEEASQPPAEAGAAAREHLGFEPVDPEAPARIEDLNLRPPRIRLPDTLSAICSTDDRDRASHAYGKAYRDIVRAFRGRVDNPPDAVARPREEAGVGRAPAWGAVPGAGAGPLC